jgi:hypothetical protein
MLRGRSHGAGVASALKGYPEMRDGAIDALDESATTFNLSRLRKDEECSSIRGQFAGTRSVPTGDGRRRSGPTRIERGHDVTREQHLRVRLAGARLCPEEHRRPHSYIRRCARARRLSICKHCPYVKASIDRIVSEAAALRAIGIDTIAIMPNDTATYREDSFDNMKGLARHGFTFPHVIDETQGVARAYGARCTPYFFGFNARDELQYRGRLDASRTTGPREAMKQVAETRARPGRANSLHGLFDQMEGVRNATARRFPVSTALGAR